jgi:hypothetical protein
MKAVAVAFALLFATPVFAQTKIPAGFLGTWAGGGIGANNTPAGAPQVELPYQELDKKLGDFLQPWALAEHNAIEWNLDDTGQACKLDGMFRPGAATGGGGFRFAEAPGKLYQVWGVDERGLQRIYFDSPHPRNLPLTWNGDSRGHFEGDDTLVVDITGFNSTSWLESDRWVHSEKLHVIERYRLFGNGQYLQLRTFVDDRLALKQPYTFTRYYRKVADATEGGEGVCNQNVPEDDLWSQRRNKLLNAHDAEFAAFVAKYKDEALPKGPIAAPAAAARPNATPLGANAPAAVAAPTVPVAAADSAKLRALAGVYGAASAPAGLKAAGTLADLPLTASAASTAKQRDLQFDPAKHCMVVGPFRMMARDDTKFELLTTNNRATLMFENIALGNKREIYLSRTKHVTGGAPTYLGDSIAHFDGDTLVVDTVGLNDMTWLNDTGAPHSESLHLVERIRPVQNGSYLEYRVTADDPKTLTQPYSYTRYYRRLNSELQEDFCEDRQEPGTK